MSNKKYGTIFVGTPDFGVPSLNALISDDTFDVVAVITGADKKVGRKQILTPPRIKKEALKHGLPVLQPKKIKDITDNIKTLNPDLIVVAAYTQLIPKQILNIPKIGSVNIHGSLLPKYRGSACIQAAILNGDKKTGVTLMEIDEGLDTGAIIAKKSIPISPGDTTGSLFEKLSVLGAELLKSSLKKYLAREIRPVPQDNKKASFTKTIKKTDGHIDWTKPALEIERFIRAMSPWPGVFSYTENKQLIKIISVEHEVLPINNYQPGQIFKNNNRLAIQCGQNALAVTRLQLEGKKILTSNQFINGHQDLINTILE